MFRPAVKSGRDLLGHGKSEIRSSRRKRILGVVNFFPSYYSEYELLFFLNLQFQDPHHHQDVISLCVLRDPPDKFPSNILKNVINIDTKNCSLPQLAKTKQEEKR